MDFIGQNVNKRIVENSLNKKELAHAIILMGGNHHGKSKFALELTRKIFQKYNHIEYLEDVYSYPHFYPIKTDDRIGVISFLWKLIVSGISKNKQSIVHLLREEIGDILSRHENGYLTIVKDKKASFPEGIKLSTQQLENVFFDLKKIHKDLKKGQWENIDGETFLDLTCKIQNSLDITHISVDGLKKLFSSLKKYSNDSRVIFIEQIEKINSNQIPKLLKILEDPPENTYFILTTNDTLLNKKNNIANQKKLEPLYSRCFKFFFQSYSKKEQQEIFLKKFSMDLDITKYSGKTTRDIQNLVLGENSWFEQLNSFLREGFYEKNINMKMHEDFFRKVDHNFEKILDDIFYCVDKMNIDLEKKNKILHILNEIKQRLDYNLTKDFHIYHLYKIFDDFRRLDV